MDVLTAWSSMRGLLNIAAPAALLLAVGCHGEVNGGTVVRESGGGATGQAGGTGSGSTTASGGGSGSSASLTLATSLAAPSTCTTNPDKAVGLGAPGPRKLWRLTASELTASIHSIFSDTANAAPVSTIFSDPTVLGFSIDANALLVQGLNASQLQDNAEAVAAWAASANKLGGFASCAASSSGAPDSGCATSFTQAFGKQAFRMPLTDALAASYSTLFMSGTSNSDGAQVVISAMLQSPHFLYRSELGVTDSGSFKLTPYEVATEIAYTLTGTTPDSTLLAAADSVVTATTAAPANADALLKSMIDQQATRLIDANSATASTAVMGFMDGWLGLSRLYTTAHDATAIPTTPALTPALQQDMWTESQSLIMEAFNNSGTFGSVLTADHSFLNKDLATFYGFTDKANALGSTFATVSYAGLTRDPGLLSTGTILNGYARPGTDSPTQRGHMIRSRLLCQAISPPPAGLNTTFTPATMVETTRDHFIKEHENGVCATCHKQMDWIGFAFENYDGFGRHRTTELGLPTVDTGVVYSDPQGNDVNVTGLSGAGSLSTYLAQSDSVTQCMQRYWTYYTFGSSTWAQDGCTYDSVYNESKTSGFTLKSTLMAIIHAASFTTRVQDQ